MRFSFFTYLVLALIVICSSCAYKQDQILFQQKNSIPDSVLLKNAANIRNYRIKSQDILQIRNLENIKSIVDTKPAVGTEQLSIQSTVAESYQVEDDGTIALTGLGHIQVAGLTRQEATKKIEALYLDSLVKSILLEVKITNLNVSILGEIKSPGNFSLKKDKTTLIELLSEAGSITEKADEKNIWVIRNQETKPLVMQVDLSDIRSITNPIIMQSGDVVYIPENIRAIRADKNQNLSTFLQPGLLVFSTLILIYSLVRH